MPRIITSGIYTDNSQHLTIKIYVHVEMKNLILIYIFPGSQRCIYSIELISILIDVSRQKYENSKQMRDT